MESTSVGWQSWRFSGIPASLFCVLLLLSMWPWGYTAARDNSQPAHLQKQSNDASSLSPKMPCALCWTWYWLAISEQQSARVLISPSAAICPSYLLLLLPWPINLMICHKTFVLLSKQIHSVCTLANLRPPLSSTIPMARVTGSSVLIKARDSQKSFLLHLFFSHGLSY